MSEYISIPSHKALLRINSPCVITNLHNSHFSENGHGIVISLMWGIISASNPALCSSSALGSGFLLQRRLQWCSWLSVSHSVTASGGAWEEGVGDVCVQGEILWCSVFFSCVCNLATWERKVLAILIRFHPNMPELGWISSAVIQSCDWFKNRPHHHCD